MLLSINQLKFDYDNRQKSPLIDIPEWHVKQGEHVFLHGPSGAGKSTLLNLLGGILLPSSGDIVLNGNTLNTMSAKQRDRFRAKNLAYVFQQFNLIPYLSAKDNIELAVFLAKKAGHKTTGLESAVDVLASLNIPDALWTKPAEKLSIGQQQRVAIARAMINQPSLMILDEPTSSLDERNRDSFLQLLLQRLQHTSTTVIFVSHDQRLASFFPQVIALNDINKGGV
ncbi:hypothetical protein LCGC14_1249380 [marine sediment metagenome]|uniref:ABC transporter domain-containing protein n=1 Tax=marine sediment metagenome TaxID=412755 RepID=A0A0F9LQG4_9ZZZZ